MGGRNSSTSLEAGCSATDALAFVFTNDAGRAFEEAEGLTVRVLLTRDTLAAATTKAGVPSRPKTASPVPACCRRVQTFILSRLAFTYVVSNADASVLLAPRRLRALADTGAAIDAVSPAPPAHRNAAKGVAPQLLFPGAPPALLLRCAHLDRCLDSGFDA
jgi:hypothetical protein